MTDFWALACALVVQNGIVIPDATDISPMASQVSLIQDCLNQLNITAVLEFRDYMEHTMLEVWVDTNTCAPNPREPCYQLVKNCVRQYMRGSLVVNPREEVLQDMGSEATNEEEFLSQLSSITDGSSNGSAIEDSTTPDRRAQGGLNWDVMCGSPY